MNSSPIISVNSAVLECLFLLTGGMVGWCDGAG